MGAPGTAFANMMKSPAFQIGIAELKQGASNKLGQVLGRFAPMLAAQTTEKGIEAVLQKADKEDPEAMKKAQELFSEGAASGGARSLSQRFGGSP